MMKGMDRWLIGIVLLVAAVVIVSLFVALSSGGPEYLAEDTPEAVVHNYLLAIQHEDYERSLRYLSPSLSGRPADSREMRRSLSYLAGALQDSSFSVRPGEPESGDVVRVEVRVATYAGDFILGGDRQMRQYIFWLQPEGATWKLIDGDGLWGWSWGDM